MDEQTAFDQWCILDLFGHTKLAGRVTEVVIAGQGFVKVDVPEVNDLPAYSRLLGPGSIYSITPVSRVIAMAAAKQLRANPITVYIPASLLPAPATDEPDEAPEPWEDYEDEPDDWSSYDPEIDGEEPETEREEDTDDDELPF
jgi:hypothetical protein